MIYRENALTTGYQPAENKAPVSKKIENILPPKKLLIPGDLTDISKSLASDLTRKNPAAEPPLPEIPLFPTGFEKKLTSSQPSIGRNKAENKFSTDIGVNKKEVSISKKPEIVRTSPKSEKNPLKVRGVHHGFRSGTGRCSWPFVAKITENRRENDPGNGKGGIGPGHRGARAGGRLYLVGLEVEKRRYGVGDREKSIGIDRINRRSGSDAGGGKEK